MVQRTKGVGLLSGVERVAPHSVGSVASCGASRISLWASTPVAMEVDAVPGRSDAASMVAGDRREGGVCGAS